MQKYLLFFITCYIGIACSGKHDEAVFTGLTVYKLYDSSRAFDTAKIAVNKFRPVKIDVFYPSIEKPGAPSLTYGDMLDMYGQRIDYNNPIDSCKKVSLQIAQSFCQYFHIDSATKFLQYPLQVYKNIALPAKKHPLVIYAASMNGSSFDNPVLFDSLVAHGYVVAVVSSVGKYPGYMSEAVDLDEQVRDILFCIEQMKAQPYVDTENIGIASWSLGGLAAMKAAMISKDIKCIASFDGNDIHAYGPDTAWDKEYNQMRSFPPYSPQAITVPYMYLRSEHSNKIDSLYNPVLQTLSGKKYFLQFKDAIHEDFSCFPVIAGQVQPSLKDIHSAYHKEINTLTMLFFDDFLKHNESENAGIYIAKLAGTDSTHYRSRPPAY
jgi:hypothetical protein